MYRTKTKNAILITLHCKEWFCLKNEFFLWLNIQKCLSATNELRKYNKLKVLNVHNLDYIGETATRPVVMTWLTIFIAFYMNVYFSAEEN